MNVLFITYGLPYPPHTGARMRDFFLLREIARRHRVTCICLLEESKEAQHIPALEQLGIVVSGVNLAPTAHAEWMRSTARHFVKGYPPATLGFWNAKLFDRVGEFAATGAFDIAQIEHSFLVPYLDALPAVLRKRSVLDLHNIGVRQYASMSELELGISARAMYRLKTRMMQNWEISYAGRFARVLTVSDDDAKWLCSRKPALRVTVVENAADTTGIPVLTPAPEQNRLFFVGTLGYAPNADAMVWFCSEILPLVRDALPDVSLDIVGRAPTTKVQALAKIPGVRLYADVGELRPYYQDANVVIVPLRAGGGTRHKILEAMAFGRAIVSTPIGAEGLDVTDGDSIVLAETGQAFAERVLYLLQNPVARARLARRASERVRARYAWGPIGKKLLDVYDEVAG